MSNQSGTAHIYLINMCGARKIVRAVPDINFNSMADMFGIGSAVQGVMNLIGTGIQAASDRKQQKLQMKHDEEMARINQENIEEQMAIQNQYNVEAWNRENAYNDPSAVRARYESAGINAAAAFGQGSASGAGIAGSLSTPTGGTSTAKSSNIMPSSRPWLSMGAGVGSLINDALLIKSQNQKNLAEADLATEKAESEKFNNEVILPLRSDLLGLEKDNTKLQNDLQEIVNEFTPKLNSAHLRNLGLTFDKMESEIDKIHQEIRESITRSNLNDQLKAESLQKVNESIERTKGYAYERRVKEVNARLMEKEIESKKFKDILTLKSAQREDAMRDYFKQYAERLASDMRLDEARKSKLIAETSELVSRNMQNLMDTGTKPMETASHIMQAVGEIIPF